MKYNDCTVPVKIHSDYFNTFLCTFDLVIGNEINATKSRLNKIKMKGTNNAEGKRYLN